MGQFFYKAVDKGGSHVTGTIDAIDRRSAVVALADKGHFVTELTSDAKAGNAGKEAKDVLDFSGIMPFGARRVSSKDILAMTSRYWGQWQRTM